MNSQNERLRKAIFGKLRTLRRKLNAQGIPCDYARSVLSHDKAEVGFRITCEATDTAILATLSLRIGTTVENFDEANFEHGLARVREALAGASSESIAAAG
jgi:hypothetical protein